MEIVKRELLSNLLVAVILALRGHYSVLIHPEDNFVLRWARKQHGVVFHTKSLNYSPGWIGLHRVLQKKGFVITSHDQEGSTPPDARHYVDTRYCKENLELADTVFVWGEGERFWLEKLFPDFSRILVPSGSPRLDIWRSTFQALGNHRVKEGPYILLTPTVGMNVEPQYWRQFLRDSESTGLGEDLARDSDIRMTSLIRGLSTVLPFCRLAIGLLKDFPEHRIILRPRPGESHNAWVHMLRIVGASQPEIDRISVMNEGPLEEWVHGASLVINSMSTAGLVAFVADVPLIVFGPSEGVVAGLGFRCEVENHVLSAAHRAINSPISFVENYRAVGQAIVEENFYRGDSFSAEAMIAAWSEHSQGSRDSRLGTQDSFLWFQPGLLRRGLRNILNLLSGAPRITIPDASVEPINRKDVARQVEIIAKALNVQEKLKVQVRGRRNIVVYPVLQNKKSEFY